MSDRCSLLHLSEKDYIVKEKGMLKFGRGDKPSLELSKDSTYKACGDLDILMNKCYHFMCKLGWKFIFIQKLYTWNFYRNKFLNKRWSPNVETRKKDYLILLAIVIDNLEYENVNADAVIFFFFVVVINAHKFENCRDHFFLLKLILSSNQRTLTP